MLRRSLIATTLALALTACASGPRITVRRRPSAPVDVRAIAVYPFAFRYEEPAWKGHARAVEAAARLAAERRLIVLGPDDFRVFRPESDDPRSGTDLPGVLSDRKLPPFGFVALRAWAERRVARTAGEISGRGIVSSTELTTWVAHVEVLDGGGRGVLVEVEGEVGRDASRGDPFDDTPELARLERRLVSEAFAALARAMPPGPPLPAVPARLAPLAGATLAWAPDRRPSLRERLLAADPVEADVARLAVLHALDPDADERALARRARLPPGVAIVDPGAWGPPLHPGDVIVEVQGRPATGPHVIADAVALAHGAPVELTIARGPARLAVTVVAP